MDLEAVNQLVTLAQTGDPAAYGTDAGKAIALGVGAGLGTIGPGIGVGYIFGKVIESVTRQPEMRDEITSIQWLGFALTEAIVFYAFIFGLIAFFLLIAMLDHLITVAPVLAAEAEGESGNFLVSPNVGLMIWTLIAFGLTLWVLGKFAFPRIQDALDRRQRAIEEAIAHSERQRAEADKLLADYRERLREARAQAEEIVSRSRKAAEENERESLDAARLQRDELLEQTRRDIDAETRRAIQEIRSEVADLTVMATEKVTRKTLTADDQRRLVDEALAELDFSALSGEPGGAR